MPSCVGLRNILWKRQAGEPLRGLLVDQAPAHKELDTLPSDYATAILEGTEWADSEEDVDELTGYHSVRQGPAPIVLHSTSKAEEAAVLAAHIKEWTQGEEDVSIGVLTRTALLCGLACARYAAGQRGGGGIGIVACGAHLLCPPWAMGFAAGQLVYSNCPYLQQAFTTQFMRQGGVDRGVAERMPDVL